MFQFFKFYLFALPSLRPVLSSELNLSVPFLVLLPATGVLPNSFYKARITLKAKKDRDTRRIKLQAHIRDGS
jgi:hypothetical protein